MSDEELSQAGQNADSGRTIYRASREAEARVLLLIDGFSRRKTGPRTLEGRVKLAKLDFLLRYPKHLATVLATRGIKETDLNNLIRQDSPLESRMMRYRYGPWDPSYFAVLGSLVGRKLIDIVPAQGTSALGYRTTAAGAALAERLEDDGAFEEVIGRIALLRRHLDLTGESLKKMLYGLPEVADATWHEDLQ
ncbi:hypothetical protein [Mycobacterium riyadhense]|uniref:Uncharacterized protein n=1 Tax=Mycobacterium riyadhense TaxID=486698 RepID=A0A1X2CE33_9MYCO|nr:hypothetical protein [Mycobacterium riyadhense]MCV7144647.1 hypothetical protein [Mycobacterium riyadhense]ORW74112.1 hypothetical protein AWC22_23605 [Mycobacterium riyadhense]